MKSQINCILRISFCGSMSKARTTKNMQPDTKPRCNKKSYLSNSSGAESKRVAVICICMVGCSEKLPQLGQKPYHSSTSANTENTDNACLQQPHWQNDRLPPTLPVCNLAPSGAETGTDRNTTSRNCSSAKSRGWCHRHRNKLQVACSLEETGQGQRRPWLKSKKSSKQILS